jgi:hypothetical protein
MLSLLFIALARLLGKRQRYLVPGRHLRYLKTGARGLVWLSTALALAAAVLGMEMVDELVYVVGAFGDGDLNVMAGGWLQVLLWVIFGIEVVFSGVTMGVLRNGRGRRADGGSRRLDFVRGWKEFEDEHIIVI